MAAAALPDDTTEAIKLLYSEEGGAVYRTIYGIVLDADVALDLTEETFTRAYRTWEPVDRSGARDWLLLLGAYLAMTYDPLEHLQVRVTHSIGQRPANPDAGRGGLPEDSVLVAGLLRPLTAEQRALVTLSYYQHVAPDAIATWLEVPVATVAVRLEEAMQILRRRAPDLGARRAQGSAAP